MKTINVITGLLSIFITMPIWYWLIYQILERVQASQLMWFLFWVYMPVGIFVSIVVKITESLAKSS